MGAFLAEECTGPRAVRVLERKGNWFHAGCGKCSAPLAWVWLPDKWPQADKIEESALPTRCGDCLATEPLDVGEDRPGPSDASK